MSTEEAILTIVWVGIIVAALLIIPLILDRK